MAASTAFTGALAKLNVNSTDLDDILSIDGLSETIERISDNDLDVTGAMQYIPADLTDHDEISAAIRFNPNLFSTGYSLGGTAVTFKITFTDDSFSTSAFVTGTGFYTGRSWGTLEQNARADGTLTFTYDGGTGPSYTAGT